MPYLCHTLYLCYLLVIDMLYDLLRLFLGYNEQLVRRTNMSPCAGAHDIFAPFLHSYLWLQAVTGTI